MNTLTIKNFGPIKDISLNLKKVNLLIGTQGSGKSTIAKVLSIMNDPDLVMADNLDKFLVDYNINYDISEKTFMEYKTPEFNVTIESNQIKHSLKKTLNDEELRKFVLSKLKISINDINKWFNTPKESLKS
jgi:predicted ATP-dependent endonuclease of OLD family